MQDENMEQQDKRTHTHTHIRQHRQGVDSFSPPSGERAAPRIFTAGAAVSTGPPAGWMPALQQLLKSFKAWVENGDTSMTLVRLCTASKKKPQTSNASVLKPAHVLPNESHSFCFTFLTNRINPDPITLIPVGQREHIPRLLLLAHVLKSPALISDR